MPDRIYGPKGFSDQAVKAATGKTWAKWYAVLDQRDVAGDGHTVTARHLRERLKLSPWWAQAVTSRYESDRGLKNKDTKS